MTKRLRNALVGLSVLAAAVGGGVLIDWLTSGPGPIRFVWFVDGATPLVAVVERHSSSESSSSYQIMRVVELESGVVRGRMEVGNGRDGNDPRMFGPFGNRAWLYTRKGGLRLLDLEHASVALDKGAVLQKVGSKIGGDLRLRPASMGNVFDYPSAQLRIEGRDGNSWLLARDLTLTPYGDQTLSSSYDACKQALKTLKDGTKLLKPDLRACFGDGAARRGLVQHASAAFGDTTWRATLFDAAGKGLWTRDASKLVGKPHAWFAGAYPRNGALLVLVASGSQLWALEMEPASGAVRKTRKVI